MFKGRVFSVVAAAICFLGFSCKVGLGEAIDTVPPTVTITYPPAGSVVRDVFVLAGDCDDDTNVRAIDVYYERTGTHPMEKAMLARVDLESGAKNWSLAVDPSQQDVKDGPYVFYAVAIDSEGRTSGTYTQSFEVDNTAPVMILTKPTSYGANSQKAYGRTVSIEGSFAEATENRIDKLVVTFYDESGNKVDFDSADDTTFYDITDMSNANPLIIAKLDTSNTDDSLVQQRNNIYTKLYGNDLTLGIAKNFYFTVTAYDKARVFNDPSTSGGTGDGNATTSFYRGTNELLNLINGNVAGYSAFSVKKIQELISGLDETYLNNPQVQGWLSEARVQSAAASVSTPREALNEAGNLTDERKAKTLNFSINPANYPTFNVSGLEILNPQDVGESDRNHTSEGYFKYYGGTPLNFVVMAGLDQTKIDVPSVSIYAAKWDPNSGRWMDGEDERQLVWTCDPRVYKGKENPTDDDPVVLPESKFTPSTKGENADSVATTVALNFSDFTGMTDSTKWKFIVVGKDINGQNIANYTLNGYGFVATINAQAAKITIGSQHADESNADNTVNRPANSVTNLNAYSVDKYKFDGTYVSSVDLTAFTYKITVSDSTRPDNPWPPLTGDVLYSPRNTESDTGTWSATLEPSSEVVSYINSHPGLYNVVVTFSAENIADISQVSSTLNIENKNPAIVLSSFSNSVKKEKTNPSEKDTYYIKADNTFSIKGNTTDNYLIGRTELKLEGDGETVNDVSDTASWDFGPVFTGFNPREGEDVKVTITAYDQAGNSSSESFFVEFDNEGPLAQHRIDAKNKDCIFRIGDFNDGAGGKYSSETWGNSTTMKIRGAFEDEGSGVQMIYYQLYHSDDEDTIVKLTADNYKTICTGSDGAGYFAPLAESYTTTVEENLANGGKKNYEAKTTFEHILTGFKHGNNILRLVAVDKVGNARLDSVVLPNGESYSDYSLNVDLTAPNIESSSIEILTNGQGTIAPISGNASDPESGIDSVEFYIGKLDYLIKSNPQNPSPYGSVTLEDSDASGKRDWTLNLNNDTHWLSTLKDEIGTHIGIYATVTNNAQLEKSAVKIASITLDTDAPTIEISNIKDAYTGTSEVEVNGTISFQGNASDGVNALPENVSPTLYYRTSQPPAGPVSIEDWTLLGSTVTGTNSWTCSNLDTVNVFGSARQNVWIMASITDKAGNTGYSAATPIIVDQNTDRPIITLTDLEDKDSWLQKNELRGTISDDDGIQDFRIYIGDSCPGDWTSGGSISSGYTVADSTGSWSLDADKVGDDGPKKVWFYVRDKANGEGQPGTVFISGTGSAAGESRPYYMYSKTQNEGADIYGNSADSYVEINKDTASPKMWTTLVSIGDAENNLKTIRQIISEDDYLLSHSLNSSKIAGGKQSYFRLYVPVLERYVDKVTAVIQDEDGGDDTDKVKIVDSDISVEEIEFELCRDDSNNPVTIESLKDHLIYTYYQSDIIDVSKAHLFGNITSGVKSIQITVKDFAGYEKTQTCSLIIDNEGPEINLISPNESEEVTGAVDVSGTSLDGDSSVVKTYWMIPDSTKLSNYPDSIENLVNDSAWSDFMTDGSTAMSWKFSFNGEPGGNPLLTRFDKNNEDGKTYHTGYDTNTKVFTLPLLIKSVDRVGNSSIKKFILRHNPDGDRPKVDITYPTSANYVEGENYAILGGTILVTGNVNIPLGTSTPDYVFLQIATDSENFGDASKLIAQNKYDLDVWDVSDVLSDVADDPKRISQDKYTQIEGFEDGEESTWWGIKATRAGSSWYIPLNSNDKMNPEGDGTTNIWIRACGINYNGKIGGWSNPVAVRIDANAPVLSASVRQYSIETPSAALETATPTAVNAYVADMFIKGEWYLTVDMTDETSLQTVVVKKGDVELSSGSDYYLSDETKVEGKARRTLWIPVDKNGSSATYTVSVTDTEGSGKHISTGKYTLNIDNEAPELKKLKGNGDDLADGSTIEEKDYVYTLSGEVVEKGSGFERILFYFVRPGKKIFNPMEKQSGGVYAETALSGLQTYNLVSGDPDLKMYGKDIQGRVKEFTFIPDTAADVTENKNIRVGGLIHIEGIYRRIIAISPDNGMVTFETNTGISSLTSTRAGFPFGQVIDNMSTEKIGEAGNAANPFVLQHDDGDLMPETVNKAGSSYTWDGTIHSVNLPDGPVTLVILAFDKAGNVSGESFTTKVQNNAPRVAKIHLGTNLNGDTLNGKDRYTQNEFNSYSIIGAIGNAAEKFELDTSAEVYGYNKPFVIKNKLAVLPEIVGGNGDIALYYKTDATDKNTAVTKNTGTLAIPIDSANVHSFTYSAGNKVCAYQIDSLGPDAESKSIGLTFWDSTAPEELERGLDTQYCTVIVTNLKVDQEDNEPPISTIDTFYWKSLNDNSVFGSETATKVSDLKGHIELESDLNELVKALYGEDPKVSGKIRITGKSYDETRLDTITFAMTSLKLNNQAKGSNVVLATYATDSNAENEEDKWLLTDGYSSGTAGGNIDSDGWQFRILTDSGLGQDGHTVTWELDLDTARIEGIVSLDEVLTVKAMDSGNNASTPGNVQTTKLTPTGFYKMDVVPYISGIDTGISKKLKSSIKAAYSRTALGHYIARDNEEISVRGFNLGSPSNKPYFGNSGSIRLNVSDSGVVTLPATKEILAASGEICLSVKSGDTYIQTLNNLNNNFASGSYTGSITEGSPYSDKNRYAYNLMPNSNSNSLLTDDVIIDVWEFDSDAAKPRSGELREPVMSINPKTGKVGVAFVSGPGDFAMAGGLNGKYAAADNSDPTKDLYSYSLWQNNYATYNNVAFAYDASGYAHATATGLDTNPSTSSLHAGRFSYFYNKWGRSGSDINGNYYGEQAIRLESLAVPSWSKSDADFKQEMTTNTYPAVPSWTKTTKDFEASFMRNQAGQIPTATLNKLLIKGSVPENPSLTETRFFSPSIVATVHGTGDSASTAVYLAYYDSTQGQIRFRYSQEVSKTWVRGEVTSADGKTIQGTTFEKWSVDSDKNVTVDEDYNEEYLTGAEIALGADGKFSSAGTFQNHMHHALNDNDDFVDNLGYFYKSKDYQAYMEANTDHFSLIAGVDYQLNSNGQKNEADFIVEDIADRMIDVEAVDNDGNAAAETYVRYRKTKIDKDAIVIDGNDYFKFKDVNGEKHLYKNNKDKAYIVEGEGTDIKLKYNFAGNSPLIGQYTYQVADLATDAKAAAVKNYGYPVFVRIKGADGKPVDSGTCEYLIPTVETVKIPVHQKQKYPSGYDTGYRAYKYVAIDALAGSDAAHDTVVAVWYDGTNCLYAYNDNPTSGLDNGSAGGWKGNKVIFTEGGEHCTVKLDSDGGVHIAAYVDGCLRYAHLSSVDAAYSEATDSVKVDSFTITGERINLDVGKDASGNVIPYISYFNGTARLPSVARLLVPENGVVNYKAQGTGTIDGEDMFTGNWEVSLVPSPMTLTTNYYDKVNIGLWKQNGSIVTAKDSRFTVTGGEAGKSSADNSSGTTNGSIYGNGTAYPIMGYAVESNSGTNLETAQMR